MKPTTDMNPNAKLSFLERFAYGIGDYAGNLVYSAISAFLLVYYTNVVGASAGAAASIIAISKILDGLSSLESGNAVFLGYVFNGVPVHRGGYGYYGYGRYGYGYYGQGSYGCEDGRGKKSRDREQEADL